MRYVIISVLKGAVEEYHKNLVDDICRRFDTCYLAGLNAPTHFTIKDIFSTDKIYELEKRLEKLCKGLKASKVEVKGFDHFDDNVIFMKVNISEEARTVFQSFIKELEGIPWMQWSEFDGDKRRFHLTLAYSDIANKYEEISRYLNSIDYSFEALFNNISIYREGEEGKWIPYRSFSFD